MFCCTKLVLKGVCEPCTVVCGGDCVVDLLVLNHHAWTRHCGHVNKF